MAINKKLTKWMEKLKLLNSSPKNNKHQILSICYSQIYFNNNTNKINNASTLPNNNNKSLVAIFLWTNTNNSNSHNNKLFSILITSRIFNSLKLIINIISNIIISNKVGTLMINIFQSMAIGYQGIWTRN